MSRIAIVGIRQHISLAALCCYSDHTAPLVLIDTTEDVSRTEILTAAVAQKYRNVITIAVKSETHFYLPSKREERQQRQPFYRGLKKYRKY